MKLFFLQRNIDLILLSALLFIACIPPVYRLPDIHFGKDIYLFFVAGLAATRIACSRNRTQPLIVNHLDYAAGLFLIYQLFLCGHSGFIISHERVIVLTSITMYWIARMLLRIIDPEHLVIVLYLIYTLLILTGILQLAHVIPFAERTYHPQAFFPNPGPYGCYLGILLLIVIRTFPFSVYRLTGIIFLLAGLAMILATSSRTALSGLLAGVASLIVDCIQRRRTRLKKISVLAGISAVLVSVVLLSLLYKQKSALARIMIWKITLNLISDHFWFGVGDNLADSYSLYQYSFFQDKANSNNFSAVAEETILTFNDYLKTFAEGGIIGLSILLTLIILTFRLIHLQQKPAAARSVGQDQVRSRHLLSWIKSAFIALTTMALFSYQFFQLEISCLFWIIIAFTAVLYEKHAAATGLRVKMHFIPNILWLLAGTWLLIYSGRRMRALYSFVILNTKSAEMSYKDLRIRYEVLYPDLKDNCTFLIALSDIYRVNGEYPKAIFALKKAAKLVPHRSIYYKLGMAYQEAGDFRMAEQEYRFIGGKMPDLLLPHYFLAKLYYTTGRWEAWRREADIVLLLKPRIRSQLTDQAKMSIHYMMNHSTYYRPNQPADK